LPANAAAEQGENAPSLDCVLLGLNNRRKGCKKAALLGEASRMGAELNNAVAATVIGAFLRRLHEEGRNPDCWEAEQVIRAMACLAADRHGQAIDHVGWALDPPSKRDSAAVSAIEKATGHLIVPTLATLRCVLDEILAAHGAFTHWPHDPAAGSVIDRKTRS
jgi:hypothetical protein